MAWTWERLQAFAPAAALRRAHDLLATDRVVILDGGAHVAGTTGDFEVSASRGTGEGSCACERPQPCAHVVALLAVASGLDAAGAPRGVRDAERAAFGPREPEVPVAAFPETATDHEIPADGLSQAQRAAIEATSGVVRRSSTTYSIPRDEALRLAGILESMGSALVPFSRRPFLRFRAAIRDGRTAHLTSAETPGLSARRRLEYHGYRAVRKPKMLVHEFEGPAAALHLLAEELALMGTSVVLAESLPTTFEPMRVPTPPPRPPPATTPRTRPVIMPVILSRRRFDWWTPRRSLQPLQAAVLERHGVRARDDVVLGSEGARSAERELIAAGLHVHRVEDSMPTLATATAAAEGEARVSPERALPEGALGALRHHGFASAEGPTFVGPAANLPTLAVALAQTGVHLLPGDDGWPPIPATSSATSLPAFADDPTVPPARDGALVLEGTRVRFVHGPAGSALPRAVRVELHQKGWLGPDGHADAPLDDAGRVIALLRDSGLDARWPRPTNGAWRLASVRYNERPSREGGGTLLHLKGPIPLGRLGGADPGVEAARIQEIVRGMEESLKRHHADARPLAHGAMPGAWYVGGGAGAFLAEAALKGASVVRTSSLTTLPLGRGVVLVDPSCLPPRLMEFRRARADDELKPVVSPEIEQVVRRIVPEGLEVDETRGHYLIPSTRLNPLLQALRELGAKVVQRRLAPRGQRYARWEPKLPEDETGARPALRKPFRGTYPGTIPGLRPACKLDPHQREGLAFILHHDHSCLLADEMGLGKTLQAIASAQFLSGRVLVVCPASARAVWKQEVHAWTTERSRILMPGDDVETFIADDQGEKYIIVAYSGLSRFGDALRDMAFELVILDESHYVKSRSAQRTRLVEEKLQGIPRRLILTGTPVMNEPKEIRTQLAFVHPAEWSDSAWFNRRFQMPWKHGMPDVKDAVLARLREYLEGVMLRREKRQALPDLPDKQLHVRRLPLPPEARRAYDEQEDGFRDYLQENEETALTGGMARTAGRLERLKQTVLIGKLPLILDDMRRMLDEGEKVVIFCHYREPIRAISKELAPYGVVTLTGSSKAQDRAELVRRFQKDDDVRVFVGQTLAAGVAVTLTAARHAVFCDLEWNPAIHRQAMDRVHRKTQTRGVEVHFYLAEDTIEEDIADVLEEKAEMMDQLLEGRTGGSFGLRDRQTAQREVALRVLSRSRRLSASETDDD